MAWLIIPLAVFALCIVVNGQRAKSRADENLSELRRLADAKRRREMGK